MELIERRSAPRFEVSIPGQACTQDSHCSFIQITNISASGLQFIVAQPEMPWLLPNVSDVNNMNPVSIRLTIEIQQDQEKVKVQCGIVYIRRNSRDTCIVGCRFEEFVEDGQIRLEAYVSEIGRQLPPSE